MWARNLRKVIKNCYTHHKSDFLLEFSKRLMICSAQDGSVIIKEHDNGTRSMLSANTNKLLVTFKSENQVMQGRNLVVQNWISSGICC